MRVANMTAALVRRFHLDDRAQLALQATFGLYVRRDAKTWELDRFAGNVTDWLVQENLLPPTAQPFEFRTAVAKAAELLGRTGAT